MSNPKNPKPRHSPRKTPIVTESMSDFETSMFNMFNDFKKEILSNCVQKSDLAEINKNQKECMNKMEERIKIENMTRKTSPKINPITGKASRNSHKDTFLLSNGFDNNIWPRESFVTQSSAESEEKYCFKALNNLTKEEFLEVLTSLNPFISKLSSEDKRRIFKLK